MMGHWAESAEAKARQGDRRTVAAVPKKRRCTDHEGMKFVCERSKAFEQLVVLGGIAQLSPVGLRYFVPHSKKKGGPTSLKGVNTRLRTCDSSERDLAAALAFTTEASPCC